jgi:hypothetical protein
MDVPLVIPIRDPLLSLITRQARHPEVESNYMIRCVAEIPEIVRKYNTYTVPIDLPRSTEEREQDLRGMFDFIEMQPPEDLADVAATWKPHNSTETLKPEAENKRRDMLGRAYKERDREMLHRMLYVSLWTLELAQPQLQPFYEKLGYRNLLWFK